MSTRNPGQEEREIEGGPHSTLEEGYSFQRLLALAACHGLCVQSEEEIQIQWAGDGMLRISACTWRGMKQQISDLAHELAHWALATPIQRQTLDFGLGWSPETNGWTSEEPCLVSATQAQYLETMASVLGMLLEAWAGHDPFRCTWGHHGWGWSEPGLIPTWLEIAGVWPYLRVLRRLGLIGGQSRVRYWPLVATRLRASRRIEQNAMCKDVTYLHQAYDPFRGWRIPFAEVEVS